MNSLYFDYKPPASRMDSTPTRKVISRAESLNEDSDKKSSARKGIERVNVDEFAKTNNDYGIWPAGKLKSKIVSTPPVDKRKGGSNKKPHLSLSSSIANKNIKGMDYSLSPNFSH